MSLSIYIKNVSPSIQEEHKAQNQKLDEYLKKSFEDILNLESFESKVYALRGVINYIEDNIDNPEDNYIDISITHNLSEMAKNVSNNFYMALWRPQELIRKPVVRPKDIIEYVRAGYTELSNNPSEYRKYNPENGYGNYEGLLHFTTSYLAALQNLIETNIDDNFIIIANT